MGIATPRSPEEITPEWLTMALQSRGAIKANVTSHRIEPIGAGAGFLGQLARVHFELDRSETGAPCSAIVKLPTLDPGGREICRLFEFYEREIGFYEHVASSCNVRVPRAYYTAMDVAADDFLLLLEDLTDVRVGDEVAGCSAAEAELVVRNIAAFHARWWESPLLDKLDWMPDVNAPVQKSAVPAYAQAALSPGMLEIGAQMKDHVGTLLDQLAPPPRTVLHGDWRLDNIFFGDGTIAAIDWQISTKGRGAFDIGYFLSSCVEPDVRRAKEQGLVRLWHEIASDGGKGGYSFDDAWTDYRRSVLFCNVYTVIGIGSLDAANERGMALFHAWLRRRSAAIEELNAGELMPS
jgi:hypothetical protein